MAAPRSCKLKPDPLGRYRPRIGYIDATKTKQKRFNLGTDRTAAEQRAAHIRSIYAKQCEHLGVDFWYEIPLQAANAVANGEPVRWQTTSEPNSYENVMEAATLHDLETLFNVRVETDNPELIKQGREELRKWIREEVRQTVADLLKDYKGTWGSLVETVEVPTNPEDADLRTIAEAIADYVAHIEKHGNRIEGGSIAPGERNKIFQIQQIASTHGELTVAELNRSTISNILSHWRNRPPSKHQTRCSSDHAASTIKSFVGFLRWLDASDYRWEMPRGIDQLNRRVVRLPNERQTSPVTVDRYTPGQLAEIIRNADDFMRAVILISLNCSFSHAEIGRVRCSDFALHTAHPHADKLGIETSTADSWLFMNRPKTHIYGEWWLWPETVVYAQKAVERAERHGSQRICCTRRGTPLYRDSSKSPQSQLNKLWSGRESGTRKATGLVTRVADSNPNIPALPFKTIPKMVSNDLRSKYGEELASIQVCHGRVSNDSLLHHYAEKPFGRLHQAMREIRELYQPVFDVIEQEQSSG